MYYRLSLPPHAGLLRNVVDSLLPRGRQLTTNAHPLVEITLMRQRSRHLVHLINLSGHSQTGYFDAVPMSGITLRVAGAFRSARIVRGRQVLTVRREGAYSTVTLPRLEQYELVEFE